ncbi:MAG: type IV toxin-antitoxin system AbiEi family antitoxin domain-containing protein [Spirochaetaceae bacterium]|nr:type IV toxin-antitoxin system AbiEi family antitoxin domain-containing protein [Spirochaetaceae bacterium]
MNEKIFEAARKNGNLISTSQVLALGFSKAMLSKYVAAKSLVRVCHGIYALPDTIIDSLYVLHQRSDSLVFSHESALFLNGLSDRTPFLATVTIPSDMTLSPAIKKECACFYIQPDLYEVGFEERRTTFGNPVRCYNMERTICDILRSRNRLDEETVISAIKNYSKSPKKDLYRLYEYARKFAVLPQIKQYLEVLL